VESKQHYQFGLADLTNCHIWTMMTNCCRVRLL
jgi:hypothetical protein